jgi:hypothetical protein
MPINKMIRKNPNSDSFSRTAKNERWVTRNIESPIASGQRTIEEIERERQNQGLPCLKQLLNKAVHQTYDIVTICIKRIFIVYHLKRYLK